MGRTKINRVRQRTGLRQRKMMKTTMPVQLFVIIFFIVVSSICSAVQAGALEEKDELTKELFQSVKNDDPYHIQGAIMKGADINSIGTGGQTPLMMAVLSGKPKAVQFLVAAQADTSIGEKDGFTPLHGAGFQGRSFIAKILVEKAGLDPLDFHPDGFAPIHRACWGREKRHSETVKVFLEAGVSPTLPSKDGKLPMEMASHNQLTQQYLKEFIEREEVFRKSSFQPEGEL